MRYPWKEWFAQRRFVLTQGKEFSCMPHSMLVMIYSSAKKHGYTVSTKVNRKEITVIAKRKKKVA